jgi:hypothetical protein
LLYEEVGFTAAAIARRIVDAAQLGAPLVAICSAPAPQV